MTGQAAHEAQALFDSVLRIITSLSAPESSSPTAHHRALGRLDELLAHSMQRLPAWASCPRLLASGAQLAERGEPAAAAELCFGRVVGLDLPRQADVPKLDAQARLSLHVQALCGQQRCQAAALMQADPQLLLGPTVSSSGTPGSTPLHQTIAASSHARHRCPPHACSHTAAR